ncbi:hypothetical protein [Novosphingobium terrae]|uniref:hypothetical protein n=1 Tax=Novosphingobium terrae TaxID=2726189 RepID=UPI001980E3A3|nr:hypothetical protein [Novosphingobium terrae]
MALAQFDGTVVEALKQTETALSTYSHEMSEERSLVHARNEAEQASRQAGRLFRFGRTSFMDVIAAQAAAENKLTASRERIIQRQI